MESYAWGPVIAYDVGHAKSYDVVGAVKSYCWVSVGPCDWCHVKSYGGDSEMYRWCFCCCIDVFGQYGYCTGLFLVSHRHDSWLCEEYVHCRLCGMPLHLSSHLILHQS